jgi:hypothetical protein
MAMQHIEIDEVGEDEPGLEAFQISSMRFMPSASSLVGNDWVMPSTNPRLDRVSPYQTSFGIGFADRRPVE